MGLIEVGNIEVPLIEVGLVLVPLVRVPLIEVGLVEVALVQVILIEVRLIDMSVVEVSLIQMRPLVEVPVIEVSLVKVRALIDMRSLVQVWWPVIKMIRPRRDDPRAAGASAAATGRLPSREMRGGGRVDIAPPTDVGMPLAVVRVLSVVAVIHGAGPPSPDSPRCCAHRDLSSRGPSDTRIP
jgi:hypothetical protein